MIRIHVRKTKQLIQIDTFCNGVDYSSLKIFIRGGFNGRCGGVDAHVTLDDGTLASTTTSTTSIAIAIARFMLLLLPFLPSIFRAKGCNFVTDD